MNKNNILHYYIHNIKVSVRCPHEKVRKFIDKSFSFFKKTQKNRFEINVNIELSEKKNFVQLSKKINKIGNNILSNNNKILFQDHGLFYEVKKKKKGIFVTVNRQNKKDVFSKTKSILRKILFNIDNYSIIRQSIILPIIWVLSRKFNIHALHGGGTAINKKGYIFSGLAGVGKSNLTLFMTLKKGFNFLSDNYLLFDDKFIYPFPEWIRIIDDSKKIMPELKNFLKTETLKRNNKNYYLLHNNEISKKVKPKVFIFTEIGNGCSFKKVKTNYAIKRILVSKNHVKEFPEHNFIGLLDLLYNFEKLNQEKELITLKKFLKKTSCFIFTLNKNISIEKNLNFLIEKSNNV
jgi:hypothetical protein